MKKRILSLLFATCVCIGMLPGKAQAEPSGLPGARSYQDTSGNIFLGGNYIEVGICPTGIFGTTAAPDPEKGFHFIAGKESSGAYLGLLADGDGWNTGDAPVAGDFFTPGSPEERWVLAYKLEGVSKEYAVATRNVSELSVGWTEGPTVSDSSDTANGTLAARVTGTTVDGVSVTMTYHFGVNDLEYTTSVTVENHSGKDITDVRFIRGFDPDQDVWFNDTYNTYNKVICNPDPNTEGNAKNYALVVARGEKTGAGVFFLSFDNRAYGKLLGGLAPTSEDVWGSAPASSLHAAKESDITWNPSDSNGYTNVDAGIMMATILGNIGNAASASTSFMTSLDPDVLRSMNKLMDGDELYETEDRKEEGPHTHIYEWGDGDKVSKEKDGSKVYQCILCGQVLEKANIPAYAYTCLTESEHVLKTPKNGTVICEMGRWNAYPRWFFEKLATRPDVDITLKFLYEHKQYTVYLPVGTEIDTSCDWYGPMKICSLYKYEVK